MYFNPKWIKSSCSLVILFFFAAVFTVVVTYHYTTSTVLHRIQFKPHFCNAKLVQLTHLSVFIASRSFHVPSLELSILFTGSGFNFSLYRDTQSHANILSPNGHWSIPLANSGHLYMIKSVQLLWFYVNLHQIRFVYLMHLQDSFTHRYTNTYHRRSAFVSPIF